MGHVVGVKFRKQGQIYYFDARPYVVQKDESVIVKTEEGIGLGRVVDLRTTPPAGVLEKNLKPIFRLATEDDLRDQKENLTLADEAFTSCRDCIVTHNLEMKLVDVEVYFDRSKMVFYFTAPGRIDFRELVKDLVRAYRTRIELRQIGVRHETQMLGAVGNCGQVCCCRRFLRKFEPVTIKMAKDQNLFLNPAKISGVCGRLLCCLAYEKDTYADFQKRIPKMGKKFQTSLGAMRTLRSNLFRDSIVVITEDNEEREVSLDEWQEIVSGKRIERSVNIPVKPYAAKGPASVVAQEADGCQPAPVNQRRDRNPQVPGEKAKNPVRPPRSKDSRPEDSRSRDARKQKKSPPTTAPSAEKKKNDTGMPESIDSPGSKDGTAQKPGSKRRKPVRKRRPRKKTAPQKTSSS